VSDLGKCEARCKCRAQVTSQLKYVLVELKSMLATRVSETVNRFASLDELRATNDILKTRVLSK
jgi:hypothetical protein